MDAMAKAQREKTERKIGKIVGGGGSIQICYLSKTSNTPLQVKVSITGKM